MNSNGSAFQRLILQRMLLLGYPGIGIKRWLALGTLGVLLVALGIAFAVSASITSTVVEVGRTLTFGGWLTGVQRGAIFGTLGLATASFAAYMLYRRIVFGARYTQRGVLENLSSNRMRRGGPRVVAVGGGTGLSTLLRGIKEYTEDITAIVTVADDGGSSGRLRAELGIPPPGDARQCLIALSESEPLMEEMLSYRFQESEGSLGGHSLGNLLLAALAETRGSFPEGLRAAAELLAVRGHVMPSSTASDLKLAARTASGRVLEGETAIGHAGEAIDELWLDPADCEAYGGAVSAIEAADAIVIGPGSLYTSVLPNFLVPGISEAVARSGALKVFVCNIATQHGETDGLSAADHLRIFRQHARVPVTHVIVNSNAVPIGPEYHQEPLTSTHGIDGYAGVLLHTDLVDVSFPSRHDSKKLSAVINRIARER